MANSELTKIAIIPARSGSKGLTDKNIMNLMGKPLIAYTIEAALESNVFDAVYVSTDSVEYGDLAKSYGARVIYRGENESGDTATSFMVIEHALQDIIKTFDSVDIFACLQPTSPLRNATHIQESMQLFVDTQSTMDFCVSMTKSEKNSDLIQSIEDGTLKHYKTKFKNYARQKYEEYYPNGAIFIAKSDAYLKRGDFFGEKSLAYIMAQEDSVDIDNKIDFEHAITILSNRNKKKETQEKIQQRIKEKKNVKSYTQEPQKKILFFGHSVLDRYPNKSIASIMIKNWGISGACTPDMVPFIREIVDETNELRHILIMLGVNDLKFGIGIEEIITNLNDILMIIMEKYNSRKIVLAKVMPNNGNLYVSNKDIHTLNEKIEQLGVQYNTKILSFSNFLNDYGKVKYSYSSDGVHLTNKGYELLEKELITFFKQ